MDPLQAAARLPALAQRSMRDAVCALLPSRGRATERRLVNAALLRFERSVEREGLGTVGRALLFTERDRIVSEMRRFAQSRLAARLSALAAGRVFTGRRAAPFDAIVGDRRGRWYGVVMRRLSRTSGRLETYRRVRESACAAGRAIGAVVLYDWVSGATRVLPAKLGILPASPRLAASGVRLSEAGAKRHDRNLGARRKMELGQDVRDVILDGLVA